MTIVDSAKSFLINKEASSVKDILRNLVEHENDTEWSARTTHFAIDYLKSLESDYVKAEKGFLPKEILFKIVLPSHGHMKDIETGILLFPENVDLKIALEYYKKPHPDYTKDCSNWIVFLKDQIKQNGFTSEIIIESINGELRHIDGLHRMMALGLLLEEGYQYNPIPIYLLIR